MAMHDSDSKELDELRESLSPQRRAEFDQTIASMRHDAAPAALKSKILRLPKEREEKPAHIYSAIPVRLAAVCALLLMVVIPRVLPQNDPGTSDDQMISALLFDDESNWLDVGNDAADDSLAIEATISEVDL